MDTQAARGLLAAIIGRAVKDRRQAVTRGLVDDKAHPINNAVRGCSKHDKWGLVSDLHFFFYEGGIEAVASLAEFNFNLILIKQKSEESYNEGRERRSSECERIPRSG
jgi:hypothetical protein